MFTMLGEASTTKIAKSKDAKGFKENKNAAKEGGEFGGVARKELEKRIKEKVFTKKNYLKEQEKFKRLK
jgi:DNA-damage-inducible protein D